MSKKLEEKHSIDFLFVLFVFLIFAFSAISSLLLGINFYRRIIDGAQKCNDSRVAIAYIKETIRQNDQANTIYLDEFDGVPAISIEKVENYVMYIYFYDGTLRELYTRDDSDLKKSDGNVIMELEEFSFEKLDDKTIKIECEDKNHDRRSIVIGVMSKIGGKS